MLKYTLGGNVRDYALRRIGWLLDEFEGRIVVSMSGGKDSTTLFNLVREVADARGIGRVPVLWLDQELEYESTSDYMRGIMHRDDVEPYWMQVPFRLANNTTSDPDNQWLDVWGEGVEWMRPRDPIALTENIYGEDRFAALLHAIADHHFPGHAVLSGMRVEESPVRMLGLTSFATYKWATWGSRNRNHVVMAPIYDWTARDVWLAIAEGGWAYNDHYNAQWRIGTRFTDMRVSNFHHEQSVRNLFTLQEIEPETWAKATARLAGIATAGSLGKADYVVRDLPFMFATWEDYLEHLMGTLLPPERLASYRAKFAEMERYMPVTMADPERRLSMTKAKCRSVVANDHEFVQLTAHIIARNEAFRLADRAARRARKAGERAEAAASAMREVSPAGREETNVT